MSTSNSEPLTTEECDQQMARINAQESAYAVAGYQLPNGDLIYGAPGLTKRELFAAMAMQGMLSDSRGLDDWVTPEQHRNTARNAVAFADGAAEGVDQMTGTERTLPDDLAYVATCDGGTGGPCCDPDCEKCWPDREPPKTDGECYRGGEAASALSESQARIQRELK